MARLNKTGDEPSHELSRDILPHLIGYQLKLGKDRVYDSFAVHLHGLGLTPGQFGVLMLIGANPGSTQTMLANALGCNRSLVLRIIDHFEAHRLVRRSRVPTDRRSYSIAAAPKGRRLIDRLRQDVQAHERVAAGALTHGELATLLRLLQRLNGAPLSAESCANNARAAGRSRS